MTCPTCGAANPDNARFCLACGHALVARGDERRVVTVVFADLVGFTALSEVRDPEQVKNLVDRCFERLAADVTAFGGQVDKIVGDAMLALFGAPVAHEDDAERAVRAALRMQETIADHAAETEGAIRLRVGVNTGEVLVGALRAGGEYTAMGDVVNTADRLQKAAEPGTVVVGPATHAATHEAIAYRSLGAIDAKGREEPVPAWVAVEPLLPPGYRRRRVQTPFVGRDAELGLLSHAVDAAVERGRAHLVLLVGEAGVGKSRLAEETAAAASDRHDVAVLEGRCVPYGEANVWWPVAEALRDATGVHADDPLERAEAVVVERVAEELGQGDGAPEVHRIAQGLLYLMGHDVALKHIDPVRAREEASRSVLAFIEAAAGRRPVVLVLSDLHWADDLVLGMVATLIDRLARTPLVVLATARQTLYDRWSLPAGRHDTVVVNLDPLDRQSTAVLLDALAVGEVGTSVRDALLDRSGGNPFFLEELVALLGEGSVAEPAPESTSGTVLADLPDTLRGLVSARIDGLAPVERATVEDAAVWGRSGPVPALERMAAKVHGLDDVGPALTGLVDKEILVVEGERWRFRSDLVREVAYSTLTKAERARRHHGIADFLAHTVADADAASDRLVDVVAYHYGAAAELARDLGAVDGLPPDVVGRALPWVREAARRADGGQVWRVAARLYGQALDLAGPAGDPRTRVELLLGRAAAESDLREIESAHADLEEAMALIAGLDDRRLSGRALVVLGDLEQKRGEIDAALATLAAAVEQYAAAGDDGGVADALRITGITQLFAGNNDDAERSIERALDVYRALGDRRGEAWALQNLAWISFIKGRSSEAQARITASAAHFSDLGDSGGLLWALGLLSFVKFNQGAMGEAEELGEQVLVEARERGDRWGEGMMLLLMAGVRLWTGRTESAVVAARDALAVFTAIGDRFGTVQATAALGRAEVNAGRTRDGLRRMQAALDGSHDARIHPEMRTMIASALAASAVQLGEPAMALRALAAAGADHDDPVALGDTDRLVAHALAVLQKGRAEEAIDALLRLLDQAEEAGPSAYAQSALALAAAVAGDRVIVDDAVARTEANPRATYLDRLTAHLAAALVGVDRADPAGSLQAFDILVDEARAHDDHVARAVAALARALVAEAVGSPDAATARMRAEAQIELLGVDATGWRLVIGLALAPDSTAADLPS
ncbi:MAG: adenylate/guanylate cyclase domain-containing protein [Acidimicrobiales bacterium]